MATAQTITLYHYTTEKGKNGIVLNNTIKKSVIKKSGSDTKHGEGVYLTELTPDTTKTEIAANNYDGRNLPKTVTKFIKSGRIDYYIEITLNANTTNLEQCFDQTQRLMAMNRNVWLYKDDLKLSNADVISMNWGATKASQDVVVKS